MQVVRQTDAVWRRGGLAGTDAAALVGCAAQSDQNVFVLLAQKLSMIELPAIREELKREAAVRKLPDVEQGTPEWHQMRSTGIGATESTLLLGAGYKDSKKLSGAVSLYEEKTGLKPPKTFENENMKRGKALEPVARAKYERLMGWDVKPLCVLHDQFYFVRASLDGLRNDDNLIVEIKCTGLPNHEKFRYIASIEDPRERQTEFARHFNYYRYQVQWQGLITGSPRYHLVGYNTELPDVEDHLTVIELFPEPGEQQKLLERAVEFWGFVERREFPPAWWLKPCHEPPSQLLLPDSGLTSVV